MWKKGLVHLWILAMSNAVTGYLVVPAGWSPPPPPQNFPVLPEAVVTVLLFQSKENINWPKTGLFEGFYLSADIQRVWRPSATILYIYFSFYNTHTFIQSFITFAAWGPSPFHHRCILSGRNLPGVQSQDCHTASLRNTIWATLHPDWPTLRPTKLRCTLLIFKLYCYTNLLSNIKGTVQQDKCCRKWCKSVGFSQRVQCEKNCNKICLFSMLREPFENSAPPRTDVGNW